MLGNLAGALALGEAGEGAVRVDTGYFYTGLLRFSPGTRASLSGAMVLPSFAFRDGVIRTVPAATAIGRCRSTEGSGPAWRWARPSISRCRVASRSCVR